MTEERKSGRVNGGSGIIAGSNVTFGNVSGQVAIGENIIQTQSIGQVDIEKLKKSLLDFQNEIARLDLPPNYQNVVNGEISAAIIEADKEKPAISEIKKKFKNAINMVKKAGKEINEISGLYEPAKKIAKLIGMGTAFLV
jgi:hypothetical protein